MSGSSSARAANRLGLDYRREAASFTSLPYGIIDAHAHIHGAPAARIFKEAANLYGVRQVYSMTPFDRIPEVRAVMGDEVRFIAIPNYRSTDFRYTVTEGYRKMIGELRRDGVGLVKFWSSPRRRDLAGCREEDLLDLRAPYNLSLMEYAAGLGMAFMVHIADPDTWFSVKYADRQRYGSKESQYEALEEVLERFPRPWIAAHMGGWPEHLNFLAGLLSRYPNLYLDCSATKWMLRELSKYPRLEILEFFTRWQGRILFGSDIVAMNEHLNQGSGATETALKASNPDEAFELYASRYWALRTFFETAYRGESPIADPDLMLLDPAYSELDAPVMEGKAFPADLLRVLYHDAAVQLLDPLYG